MSLGFVGCLFNDRIPHLGGKFLIFYADQLSSAIYSSRPFWNCVRGLQRSLVVLFPHYCPMPSSRPHPHSCAVPCCIYVFEPEQRCFSWERAALPLSVPLLQPHPVHSHSVIANNPWLLSHQSLDGSTAIGDRDTINISPLSSPGAREHLTRAEQLGHVQERVLSWFVLLSMCYELRIST